MISTYETDVRSQVTQDVWIAHCNLIHWKKKRCSEEAWIVLQWWDNKEECYRKTLLYIETTWHFTWKIPSLKGFRGSVSSSTSLEFQPPKWKWRRHVASDGCCYGSWPWPGRYQNRSGRRMGFLEEKRNYIQYVYIYIYNCTYHILHLPIFFKKDIWNNFKKK